MDNAEIVKIKSEAIKEFAERLKEKADKYGLKYWATVEDIDNLVEEMTNDFKEEIKNECEM